MKFIIEVTDEAPSAPGTHRVKGGDLKIGDTVLIPAQVVSINEHGHVFARPESPWMSSMDGGPLWTWGGQYGSGIDRDPDITVVDD